MTAPTMIGIAATSTPMPSASGPNDGKSGVAFGTTLDVAMAVVATASLPNAPSLPLPAPLRGVFDILTDGEWATDEPLGEGSESASRSTEGEPQDLKWADEGMSLERGLEVWLARVSSRGEAGAEPPRSFEPLRTFPPIDLSAPLPLESESGPVVAATPTPLGARVPADGPLAPDPVEVRPTRERDGIASEGEGSAEALVDDSDDSISALDLLARRGIRHPVVEIGGFDFPPSLVSGLRGDVDHPDDEGDGGEPAAQLPNEPQPGQNLHWELPAAPGVASPVPNSPIVSPVPAGYERNPAPRPHLERPRSVADVPAAGPAIPAPAAGTVLKQGDSSFFPVERPGYEGPLAPRGSERPPITRVGDVAAPFAVLVRTTDGERGAQNGDGRGRQRESRLTEPGSNAGSRRIRQLLVDDGAKAGWPGVPLPKPSPSAPLDDGLAPVQAGKLTETAGSTEPPIATRRVEVSVPLADEQGDIGRLKVAVHGQAVRATLIPTDERIATEWSGNLRELRQRLQAQGFPEPSITVQAPRSTAPIVSRDLVTDVTEVRTPRTGPPTDNHRGPPGEHARPDHRERSPDRPRQQRQQEEK